MTTIFDIPAKELIDNVAEKLKGKEEIHPPEWAEFVKTGVHREKMPVQEDWWFIRTAAVLRKVYLYGPIGTSRLSAMFGGPRDRGSKPNKARKGSRAIIRHALIQLEKAGFIISMKKKKQRGRIISPVGRSFLDNTAHEVLKKIKKEYPGLEKF
jgi:small subunit ribosomal protein S19e